MSAQLKPRRIFKCCKGGILKGTSISPNLNRHTAMGEVRINLLAKDRREQQSHEIALRIRPEIERLGKQYGANLKIVEIPPGLSDLVAEVYGPPEAGIDSLVAVSKRVRADMEKTEGVVDVDDYSEA